MPYFKHKLSFQLKFCIMKMKMSSPQEQVKICPLENQLSATHHWSPVGPVWIGPKTIRYYLQIRVNLAVKVKSLSSLSNIVSAALDTSFSTTKRLQETSVFQIKKWVRLHARTNGLMIQLSHTQQLRLRLGDSIVLQLLFIANAQFSTKIWRHPKIG